MNSFFDWIIEYNDQVVNSLLIFAVIGLIILPFSVYFTLKKLRGKVWWL